MTMPQLAIAYDLSHPALTSALVGVRKPSHILSVLPSIDMTLDEATLAEIRKIAVE